MVWYEHIERRNIPVKPQREARAPRKARATKPQRHRRGFAASFLLPMWGEETSFSSPCDRRSLFSPRSLAKASSPYKQQIGIVEREQHRISKFLVFFLLPRLIPPDNEQQWSKSTVIG
ncbi:hypothetical protein BHE74_00001144 [Ensete ventricosum]|nr:hypothetical protein BHE74_00001144 [Ensete ventricosum]